MPSKKSNHQGTPSYHGLVFKQGWDILKTPGTYANRGLSCNNKVCNTSPKHNTFFVFMMYDKLIIGNLYGYKTKIFFITKSPINCTLAHICIMREL